MGETIFYSDGPKLTEERLHLSFGTGLCLAWTPSMIQNLTKGVTGAIHLEAEIS